MTHEEYEIFKKVFLDISEAYKHICDGERRCMDCPYFHFGPCETFKLNSVSNRCFLRATDAVVKLLIPEEE